MCKAQSETPPVATATAAKQTARSQLPASPGSPKLPSKLTLEELSAAFRAPFPKRRPHFGYALGLLITAATMLVLPLIYIAFIALVAFLVYYHATNDAGMVGTGTGQVTIYLGLVYVAPLIAGPIAILFLIKPLLARPSQLERFRSLTRQSEPLLFAFVDRICSEVGAPHPSRIDVNCTNNAAAHFRRGFISMLRNDLVLTFGLPLVADLTLQEFAGVLAHEFGHFSQGLGMRLTFIVRSIVHWFVRVVYQRDQWDATLEHLTTSLNFRIAWIFLVAQLFVMIGRGLLWLLFHVGLAVSGIMLRQMEFDADSYEVRIAGSDAFGKTTRKLQLLSAAFELAQQQLSISLEQRKLVENLPALIVHHAKLVAPLVVPKIEQRIASTKTGWFDSHPCDRDRIMTAESLGYEGSFHSDRLASELFSNFDAQSAAATWDLYVGIFGPKVPRTALMPLDEFITQHDQHKHWPAPSR